MLYTMVQMESTLHWFVVVMLPCKSTGDGPAYRDALIECNVIPALLSRISPETPVSTFFFLQGNFNQIQYKHQTKHFLKLTEVNHQSDITLTMVPPEL